LGPKKPEPLVVSGKLPVGVTAGTGEVSVMVTLHVDAVPTVTGVVHVMVAVVDLPGIAKMTDPLLVLWVTDPP
jgi:hypothetical protein